MSESETKTIKEYRSNTAVKTLYDWLEMFAYALAVVLLILTFGARHSPVKGTSMLDTLHDADILIVSSGLFYKPKAGDIVVFQTKTGGYNEPYVKRVIALGGQAIDINFNTWEVTVGSEIVDGKIVDGEVIPESSYVLKELNTTMLWSRFTFPMVIPEGSVFCMGDNRNHSRDSRDIGPIEERFILGRVIFRVFPFGRFGVVK